MKINKTSASSASQQSTPPLLHLPPELRDKIYAYVFSGYRIRVFSYRGGKFHYVTLPDSELRSHTSVRKDFKQLIALTRACRLLY
ncbi:hypothetical protein E8E11_004066 [Didymella keratinophila]|nr:hypothetical protein E8E11_004066 [Didymella keratinophila]